MPNRCFYDVKAPITANSTIAAVSVRRMRAPSHTNAAPQCFGELRFGVSEAALGPDDDEYASRSRQRRRQPLAQRHVRRHLPGKQHGSVLARSVRLEPRTRSALRSAERRVARSAGRQSARAAANARASPLRRRARRCARNRTEETPRRPAPYTSRSRTPCAVPWEPPAPRRRRARVAPLSARALESVARTADSTASIAATNVYRGRIDHLDAVAGAQTQHVRDLVRIATADHDDTANLATALDEEPASRGHYSGRNASFTRSKNVRSSTASPPARAYSSRRSRWRLLSLVGTAT